LLQRYENLVDRLYCEPKEEIIMGKFVHQADAGIIIDTKKKKQKKALPATKDKLDYFLKNLELEREKPGKIIVIE